MLRRATVAIILSAIIVGIGQAYLGQFYRGASIFVIGIALVLTLYFFLGTLGILLATAYWIWNIVDVYKLGIRQFPADNTTKGRQCPNCYGSGAVRTGSSMGSIYAPSLSFTRCPLCGGRGSIPHT